MHKEVISPFLLFSLAAYACSFLFVRVFDKYIPEHKDEETESTEKTADDETLLSEEVINTDETRP